MKKLFFAIAAIAAISIPAQAKYSGGSGTSGDPYQIATVADLLDLAADTGDYDKSFVLTADIDLDPNLPGNQTFTASVITNFAGVFDGTGHKITNLTGVLGLFGVNDGDIKNLRLENVSITSGNSSSCIGGLAGFNYGDISDCCSTGVIFSGAYSSYLGGLVAINDGNISDSYSTGAVTSQTDSNVLGGLVGANMGNLSNCYSTCVITSGPNSLYVGGLVGNYSPASGNTSISNCYSTGAVTSGNNSRYLGGLVGNNFSNLSNCYSTSTVSGGDNSSRLGGLVGSNSGYWGNISNCYSTGAVTVGANSQRVGGLAGYNVSVSYIGNCYSTGAVTVGANSLYFGGLLGATEGSNISNCFFLDTSGPFNGIGTYLTDTQMKQQSSFYGWDFVNVWQINEGIGYPQLRVFGKYSSGFGTPAEPYRIANAADLLALAADTGDYDKSFVLTADIDLDPNLPGGHTFSAAVIAPDTAGVNYSFDNPMFTGVFDGAGHKISNLTINVDSAEYIGLFGYVDGAELKNLRLENVNINTNNYSLSIGGLAGYCHDASVSGCSSTGGVAGGNDSYYFGGLVGFCDIGNISECNSAANVVAGMRAFSVGGLAGYCNTGTTINDCNSSGAVTGGISSSYLGGLVGFCFQNFSISDCCAMGDVTGGDSSQGLGGLLGYAQNQGDINNCSATGAVSGGVNSQYLGGLAGYSYGINNSSASGSVTAGDNSFYLGGLAGFTAGDVNYCSASGAVTDGNNSEWLGGLTGHTDGNICNCSASGIVTTGDNSQYLGGLAGNCTNIADCSATGAVAGGVSSQYLGGLAGRSYDISGSLASGSVTGGDTSEYLAGLVGYASGEITGCSSSGAITAGYSSFYLGGLAGGADANFSDCFASGAVASGAFSYELGGLVGFSGNSIRNCSATGAVTGSDNSSEIGGLVGYSNGQISRCFSSGSVTGGDSSSVLGGLVGFALVGVSDSYSMGAVTAGDSSYHLGGLIGYNQAVVATCYSTGAVAASGGGLIGYNGYGSITNCYFLVTSGPNNSFGIPLTNSRMKLQRSFVGFDFVGETINGANDVWIIYNGLGYPRLAWQFPVLVAKCTVTAGSKVNSDSIFFSGIMNARFNDLNTAGAVEVFVDSQVLNDPCIWSFTIDANTFKKGKFNCSRTVKPSKTSFTFDTKTAKFSFTAKNFDLSGLSCPLTSQIKIDDYACRTTLDETIVNGPKKLIPVNLLMGVKNVLRVDVFKIMRDRKTGNISQLSAKGGFAVEHVDVNMAGGDFNVMLAGRTFTIPAGNFKANKTRDRFTCSNVLLYHDPNLIGIASANFNFKTCAFTLTIKNTKITAAKGATDHFIIEFPYFNEDVDVNLP